MTNYANPLRLQVADTHTNPKFCKPIIEALGMQGANVIYHPRSRGGTLITEQAMIKWDSHSNRSYTTVAPRTWMTPTWNWLQ